MRYATFHQILLLTLGGLATPALAVEPADLTKRTVVDIPANVAPLLRGEMVALLGAMQQVFALAGEGKHTEAANLAEQLMGRTAIGRHAGGIRPGMFMPPEMRTLAQGLHQTASDWSFALRTGDRQRADAAFAQVLGSCSGCHQNFQLRRQ